MSPQPFTDIATLAARLAERLPEDDLQTLAAAARDGEAKLTQLKATAGSATVRGACDDVRAALKHGADGTFLAGALLGVRRAVERLRDQTAVDIVWTGPQSDVHTTRLTSAVVWELIDEAREEILLVSYATYPPQELTDALQRAIDRGVHVTVLLERNEDNPQFHGAPIPFADLKLKRLAWPGNERPAGSSLHAKVLVIDRRIALVGSANLTSSALEKNLECGIWIRSKTHVKQVVDHIASLRQRGTLRQV